MAQSPFIWPKKGDQAFRASVHLTDQDAIEAFVFPSDGAYLVGFQRGADMIVDAAKDDNLNPDELFFPVAYLYRHHIELMLKELVRLGTRVGVVEEAVELVPPCPSCGHAPRASDDPLSQHNLHKLWNKAKLAINAVWPDQGKADLAAVERVILEFHKLDPTGQAFRYARDKAGGRHLQDAPSRVDLRNLKAIVDAVSRFLDACYAGIDACDPGPP